MGLVVWKAQGGKGNFLLKRDYARAVSSRERTRIPPSRSDESRVYYVSPDQSFEDCMAQMSDKHIRHLPVVQEGKVIGVISIGDVVKAIIGNQLDRIHGLENYILGREYHL